MEHTSEKNEFGDKVEVKPINIVPKSSHSENDVFVSSIKADENLESTTYIQGFEVNNSKNSPTVGTVDSIKRWTVSSSVILPSGETEDGFDIEPAHNPTRGMLLADAIKNEDTDAHGGWGLNQHTGQVAFIPNLSMNPSELTRDSDSLISPWRSNEQFDNSSAGDSQVKTFSEPTSMTDDKFSLKVGYALCRDPKAVEEIPLFKCHLCGISFTTARYLSVHNCIGTGIRPHECDVCNRTFTQSGDLKIHQRIHTGEKPYKCDVCNKTFTQSGHLTGHQRLHTGEKPYKCDVCDKEFNDSSGLRRHQRTHTGEKPYMCDVCGKKFSHTNNLKAHQRIHTGEKPYKCDVCTKEFSDPSTLITHKRVHTGEKPYKCDVCNKHFTNLRSHQRTHTGEKPYKCDVCEKEFTSSSSLSTHQRTHTGEKPYTCDVCNRKFTQSCNLKTHQRIHTMEKPF